MSTDIDRPDAHDDPSDAELDATDLFLSSIATGIVPTVGDGPDPMTDLLRAASGPAGAGELDGADQFVAAVSSADMEPHMDPRRASASPAALVGKAVAAKAAVIAAVTVLGIAGAGAATGVILRVANDSSPQPIVTVDDPDVASTNPNDRQDLSGPTRGSGGAGATDDPVRVRTCAAATDGPGLERLAHAATAANSTAGDYCRGTGTLADPDRPGTDARADSVGSTDDQLATGNRRADAAVPSDRPVGDNGNGNHNGGATPGTPNTNANPKATNGANNGATNGGGTNSNSNNGNNNGAATPGTPNTNANPNATNGGGTNSSNNNINGAATPGTPNTNATNGGSNRAGTGAATGTRPVDRPTGGAGGNDAAPDHLRAGRGGVGATPAPTPPGT